MESVGDLGCQALLELGATGVTLHHPGQLGWPHDPPVGYVTDVSFTDQGAGDDVHRSSRNPTLS